MATPRKLVQFGVPTPLNSDAMDTSILQAFGTGKQEGVDGAGNLLVTSGGAGLNLSVASGFAFVKNDTSGLLIPVSKSAGGSVAPGAAHATLPRIDQVVISTGGTISIVAGTPTSGATLANRSGAAALPNDRLRLADVLVPAAFTGPFVAATHLRDRRPWASGYFKHTTVNGLGTITTTQQALSGATSLNPRIECSGAPLEVQVDFTTQCDLNVPLDTFINSNPMIDGVDAGASGGAGYMRDYRVQTSNRYQHHSARWVLNALTPGSHVLCVSHYRTGTNTGTIYTSPNGSEAYVVSFREILQPVGSND